MCEGGTSEVGDLVEDGRPDEPAVTGNHLSIFESLHALLSVLSKHFEGGSEGLSGEGTYLKLN